MDYFRKIFRAGQIDAKTYDKMIEIVYHLEEESFSFGGVIGGGSYGYVIKVKHATSGEEKAVKIVSKEHVSIGETQFWSTLKHINILPLVSMEYVYHANSYLFFTHIYPYTLEEKIIDMSLANDCGGFEQAIRWMKDIVDAVSYLHGRGLAHLDVKCNNVLVSDDHKATLMDFGFLSTCEKPIDRYGAPLLYRCPEGRLTEFGLSTVKGDCFDVWSLGALSFELFTGMYLLKEVSQWKCPLICWHTQIYPVLQQNLKV